MDQPCEVCGAPLAAHTMALRSGVAQTIGKNGLCCSGIAAEREYLRGSVAEMDATIRSLRYIAGRDGLPALATYSDRVAEKRETTLRRAAKWFPWGRL